MIRYKMIVCYDGTNYHGWQVQPNAITIQPVIQDALEAVLKTRPDVCGCSRTDSGVHANEYCFHFDCSGSVSPDSMVKAINTKLPRDIAAIDCEQVSSEFHARYSVKSKQYIYRFYDSATRNPFLDGYAFYSKNRLDVEKMKLASSAFIGKHDFSAFCAAGSSVESNIRTVYSAQVTREDNVVSFIVEADGFLYNMVRIMAGTLYYVSIGKIQTDKIEGIIHSKKRENAGKTMPACGLFLNKVFY